MSVKIQDVLAADEVVISGARLGPRRLVLQMVGSVFLLFAITYGIIGAVYLAGFMKPNLLKVYLLSYLYYFIPVGAAVCIYTVLNKGEAVVTDRRLLRRDGVFKPRIREIGLSKVKHVHGLAKRGSVSVESQDGEILYLNGLPGARELGWAVAQASGLKLPSDRGEVSLSRKRGL